MTQPFFTIGHSTRTIEQLVDLLRVGEVRTLVDVRTIPRSRHNPQYNEDVLGESLGGYQIGYTRIAELGGRRSRVPGVPPDVNGWWDNQSFHNYADYALTSPDFRRGLDQLIALGSEQRVAIMCAESVWWRCHRRIVADYLLAGGELVFHLMGEDRVEPARLSEAAQAKGEGLAYPTKAPHLPLAEFA